MTLLTILHVKLCFRGSTLDSEGSNFKSNCAKSNKHRPTPSAAKMMTQKQVALKDVCGFIMLESFIGHGRFRISDSIITTLASPVVQGGPKKSKPGYFCNNFVYC